MNDRRSEPAAFGIRDYQWDAGVNRGHQRVGGAQINADDATHGHRLPRCLRTEQACRQEFDVFPGWSFCYPDAAMNAPSGIHPIRGIMGCCFLLVDGGEAVMIDTGLFGEMPFIRRLVQRLGLTPQSVKAILLTHGHLDHAGNLARLKEWTGARVFAHRSEQAHVNGTYPYQGINKWCGRLEALGRAIFNYQPAVIDESLSDGQLLPFWAGCESSIFPATRQDIAAFSASDMGCCLAATCSPVISLTSINRPRF